MPVPARSCGARVSGRLRNTPEDGGVYTNGNAEGGTLERELIRLITSTINVTTLFSQPYVVTRGGPSNETLTPLLHIYNIGFQGRRELSIAAAMGLVVAAMMIIVSIVNFRLFSSERS